MNKCVKTNWNAKLEWLREKKICNLIPKTDSHSTILHVLHSSTGRNISLEQVIERIKYAEFSNLQTIAISMMRDGDKR